MYATLSYDVNAGMEPIEDVRQAIVEVFADEDRDRCDLLSDTFICGIDDTADYLKLTKSLRQVAKDFPGQFQFVFTLHESGSPLRSNGKFPKDDAKAIIKGEEEE